VRIGLIQAGTISFSGLAGVTVQTASTNSRIAWAPPRHAWSISADGGMLFVRNEEGEEKLRTRGKLRLLPPEDGVVTIHGMTGHWDGVEDRDYRGVIEVLRHGGELTAVNVLDIETYLRGVVPSEMPTTYPMEALKAQAVAARGQALAKAGRHKREGFDLCATQHCQVYGGATSEAESTNSAVTMTWGQVLEYEGRLANTLYSSNCGGYTANNEDYWPDQKPIPYLRSVPDFNEHAVPLVFPLSDEALSDYLKYAPPVYCNQPWYGKASKFRWWFIIPREELRESLVAEIGDFGDLIDVRVTERADCGMALEVTVIGTTALYKLEGGSQIRRGLGGLNSASFAIRRIAEGEGVPAAFAIWGAGWGHQVGMCQIGAAGLADRGWDYEGILSKYYTGCTVTRRY